MAAVESKMNPGFGIKPRVESFKWWAQGKLYITGTNEESTIQRLG